MDLADLLGWQQRKYFTFQRSGRLFVGLSPLAGDHASLDTPDALTRFHCFQ